MSTLTAARYGKDKVRVFRIARNGAQHEVAEYNITVLLEGDIDTSYTQADNCSSFSTFANLLDILLVNVNSGGSCD
jgi:urate oxidase